ncbi:MAG: ferrous iron transport protein A [Promethearchaeota archaeon]
MDEKGTIIDKTMQIRLTSVSPGKTCRLVGVSRSEGSGFGRRGARKHKRGHGGWFFGNPERRERRKAKWEEKQKKWEQWRGDWDETKRDWHRGGGRGVMKRLLDLGLTKGCTFKVVQGSSSGPILVEVRGTRIALGHELARRVIVEVLED